MRQKKQPTTAEIQLSTDRQPLSGPGKKPSDPRLIGDPRSKTTVQLSSGSDVFADYGLGRT